MNIFITLFNKQFIIKCVCTFDKVDEIELSDYDIRLCCVYIKKRNTTFQNYLILLYMC